MDQLTTAVKDAIQYHKRIKVIAYSMTANIEHKIKKIIYLILSEHGYIELLNPIYTMTMELFTNAVRANYKNIFFEGYVGDDSTKIIDYQMALQLFKLEIIRQDGNNMERLAREKSLSTEIIFRSYDDMLYISVMNNVGMTSRELKNVYRKLDEAKQCRSLTEYFLKNQHDPNKEGAGLGLVLVSMILKSLGVDQSNLSIKSHESSTISSLTIPLNRDIMHYYFQNVKSLNHQ